MSTLTKYLLPFLAAGLIFAFTACQKEGPMEKNLQIHEAYALDSGILAVIRLLCFNF